MSSKNSTAKTADTWTTSIEEMLAKAGLTPKEGNKKGSLVMPARYVRGLSRDISVLPLPSPTA